MPAHLIKSQCHESAIVRHVDHSHQPLQLPNGCKIIIPGAPSSSFEIDDKSALTPALRANPERFQEAMGEIFGQNSLFAGFPELNKPLLSYLSIRRSSAHRVLESYTLGQIDRQQFDRDLQKILPGIWVGVRAENVGVARLENALAPRHLADSDLLSLALCNPSQLDAATDKGIMREVLRRYGPGGASKILAGFGIEDSTLIGNLFVRAANSGNLESASTAPFSRQEIAQQLSKFLLQTAGARGMNEYCVIASALNYVKGRPEAGEVKAELVKELTSDGISKADKRAIWFLLGSLEPRDRRLPPEIKHELSQRSSAQSNFIRTNFESNGKLVVCEIFDQNAYFGGAVDRSKATLSEVLGVPTRDHMNQNGREIIFENERVKVVIFNGIDTASNNQYLSRLLAKNPGLVVTYRGRPDFFDNPDYSRSVTFAPAQSVLLIPEGQLGHSAMMRLCRVSPTTDISVPKLPARRAQGDIDGIVLSLISTQQGQVGPALDSSVVNNMLSFAFKDADFQFPE
jgi:hypothetical protein